jgi:hypothetical protein
LEPARSRIALSAWRDKRWTSGHIARLRLGNLEHFDEVLIGAFITLIGIVFGLWPVLQRRGSVGGSDRPR